MSAPNVAVVALGSSNVGSVQRALASLGARPTLVDGARGLEAPSFSHVILPGVGAFAPAAEALEARGLHVALRAVAARGVPLLGICLGMQLLATTSEEGGMSRGLDLLAGHVSKLDASPTCRLPHVGWNAVALRQASALFEDIPDGADFYFTHSYCVRPMAAEAVVAVTEHAAPFCSVIGAGNVFGVQFHPEKSQTFGMKLLGNFLRI